MDTPYLSLLDLPHLGNCECQEIGQIYIYLMNDRDNAMQCNAIVMMANDDDDHSEDGE